MRKSLSGFTFLELLVALTLFTVGMLSVLQIFPINRRFLNQSAMLTQSSFLAQQAMEYVNSLTYSDLITGNSPAFEPLHAVSSVANDPLSQYTRKTEVFLVDPDTPGYPPTTLERGIKKVTVTVYWTDRSLSRQFSLTTLVQNK